MFCSKCGAAVTGNYCCVCGERVRSAAWIFRRKERQRRSIFKASTGAKVGTIEIHIADACWHAAANKYKLVAAVIDGDNIQPDAYDRLQKTEALARRLYMVLMEELEEM